MNNIQCWEIGPRDEELAVKCSTSLNNLYKNHPADYKIDLYTPETPFIPQKSRRYFVIGEDLGHLLGYANCYPHRAQAKVETASALLASAEEMELMDCNGKTIHPRLLSSYDGYSLYTGKGDILYIAQLEVFERRKKYGSQLLQHIQSKKYELIEIEAEQKSHLAFLKSNGFIASGAETEDEALVMVWHNPLYKHKQQFRT